MYLSGCCLEIEGDVNVMQEPSEFSPHLGDFRKEANYQYISLAYLSCKRDYLIDPDLVQIPKGEHVFFNVYLVSLCLVLA